MKLHCPDILRLLATKPIIMASGTIAHSRPVPASDKYRKALLGQLVPMIHKAEKFIFDSGQDKDAKTTQAVRETAVNMLEANLFHLPHPMIWVEDPFTEDGPDITRNFYLIRETARQIIIRFFQRMDYSKIEGLDFSMSKADLKSIPPFILHLHPLIIELDQPSDKFIVANTTEVDPATANSYGEAVYSVKKLVVALNSRNIIIERVAHEPARRNADPTRRSYAHSIVRIPSEIAPAKTAPETTPSTGTQSEATPGRRVRYHLVRGFVYGKNTRPVEQQRWVQPYWRGDKEVGIVEHTHYEVRG